LHEQERSVTQAAISGRLDLERDLFDTLVAHARSDFPFEVCGLLAGQDGKFVKHYAVANEARSMTFYRMDSKALLAAMNDMEANDWELASIYHSHPHTEAFPSPTDVELAFYPDAVYLLVSLQDEQPVMRAFNIVDGKVTELDLYVDGTLAPVGPR
jgi:proteasome lid subunit RPN8/RPN11